MKHRIQTDIGNIGTLKACLVAAAKGIELKIDIEPRDSTTSPSRLPVIYLPENITITEGNAIALYLASDGDANSELKIAPVSLASFDAMEWESRVLAPAVRQWLVCLGVQQQSPDLPRGAAGRLGIKPKDDAMLKAAEKTVIDAVQALVEPMVSSSTSTSTLDLKEIIVWASLYPAHTMLKTVLPGSIVKWFERIHALPWVADALKTMNLDENENESAQDHNVFAVSAVWRVIRGNDLARKIEKAIIAADPTPAQGKGKDEKGKGKEKKEKKEMKEKKDTKDKEKEKKGKEKEKEKVAMRVKEGVEYFTRKPPRTDTPPSSRQPPLPIPGQRNVLITSALPYVNNVPHLGNIIGCVLSGDVYARYCRLRGYNTVYVCGTDEYGTATEKKAIEEGVTPKEICDKYYDIHRKIYDWFDIDFDIFGRTSTPRQTEITQDIFKKLDKNGLISEKEQKQLRCPKCELFLADRFVEGDCPKCQAEDCRGDQCDKCGALLDPMELKNPRCVVCRTKPEPKATTHLFFDLSKMEPKIKDLVDAKDKSGAWSQNAVSISNSWIQAGLLPRSITRDLKWGTPVPPERLANKVFYVWFEATLGYISITANLMDKWKLDWQKWWMDQENVELVQFMGKDNVPFHAIIFPATEMGTKDPYVVVNQMSVTEYLNYEDTKFSKSRGTGVFGDNAVSTGIPSEVFRFYLLSRRPESSDTSFCWSDLQGRNNSELLANLGNFINRTLKFAHDKFDGVVPSPSPSPTKDARDQQLIDEVNSELKAYVEALESQKLKNGINHIMKMSASGNLYLQDSKPWVLLKGGKEGMERARHVIWLCCCLVKTLTAVMEPYMPTLTEKVLEMFPVGHSQIPNEMFLDVEGGMKLISPGPLVRQLEDEEMETLRKKFAGSQ